MESHTSRSGQTAHPDDRTLPAVDEAWAPGTSGAHATGSRIGRIKPGGEPLPADCPVFLNSCTKGSFMTETRRSRYPSDLTQAQWDRLKDILPLEPTVGRNRVIDLRDVANAINYRWETGCVWRMLPHDFPPWGTVYSYFRAWQRAGVTRQLRDLLLEPRQKAALRFQPTPSQSTATSPDRESSAESVPRVHPAEEVGFSSPHDRRDANPPQTLSHRPGSERTGM